MTIEASIAKSEYDYKSIRQLGIGILVQAAKDAFMSKPTISDKKSKNLIKSDAISFLTSDTRRKDLDIVCEMAGLSADSIQAEARKLVDSGAVDIEKYYDLTGIRKKIKIIIDNI